MADERRTRTLYWLALLAILLAAAFLRFYRLDASSLWSDEGNTWAMLGRTYSEIAHAAAADIHPPGYYWLLKLWSGIFGASAWAMRSFSAAAGVLLVLVVERIGRLLAAERAIKRWLPLLAAFIAAVNPLLVYYSQEARMYMLLALAGAGLFWAMLAGRLWAFQGDGPPGRQSSRKGGFQEGWVAYVGYVFFAALGLWTHYSFAIVLAAANLAWVVRWAALRFGPARSPLAAWRALAFWIGINLVALLVFLPWLPTAVARIANWPKGGVAVSWTVGMEDTLRTLLFGPLHGTPDPLWPWLGLGALLAALGTAGLYTERRRAEPGLWRAASGVLPLVLWLGLPIGLMAGLGLFTDAFLKFLITAVPAWCLLSAAVPLLTRRRAGRSTLGAGVAVLVIGMAGMVLPGYYQDAYARDNYKGIADFIAGRGEPARDLVILDAPGQQEVWRYYDPGLPVLALPATRPASADEVAAQLASATADRRNVYALFWATDEADPQRLVETWLDRNAFKALDVWQGNVRLATYALASGLQPLAMEPVQLGDAVVLAGQAQPAQPEGQQHVAAGDAALVQLRWEVLQDVERRYKVSVQLLDAASQVVAQRDAEPVGGARPTDGWRAGEQIFDNYALPVPFGTPPGEYRLLAAMYDAQTGQRLTHAAGDSVELGSVWVERPQAPLSPNLVPMGRRLDQHLGPVSLAGYDAYRKDFAHAPATPLRPGDTAHFVLYWQAPDPLPANWPAALAVTLRLGDQVVTMPLAGAGYATGQWTGGEIVRGQYDIPYDGTGTRAQVDVAGDSVELAPLPAE